jgi:hypothetical protein
MTDVDFGTFDRAFRRVVGAFRLKLREGEVEELSRTYFKVLDAAPLDDVLTAGKACLANSRTFPKPAEWLHALPIQPPTVIDADLRVMGTYERVEHARAEALRYEDTPCECVLCGQAHVTHRPLRFVPDDIDGALDRAIDTVRNRILVTGHWAHGEELARWYAARDAFFASVSRHTPIARALLVLVSTREPGEEG